MPICAIYARVSDEEQAKGESVAHQISFLQEFARRRSEDGMGQWIVPPAFVFRDEGVSGTSIIHRVAVQALIRYAKTGAFDVVLFKGISRFARDTVDALVMLRTLQACGTRVISFEENFDSARDNAELIFTMHSAVAQYESEKIGIRVRLGNYEKARQGKWCGVTPDGYKLNARTQRLELDPARVPAVQELFRLSTLGYGTLRIADELNRAGYRTRAGALWSFTTVRRMLRNPVYVGDVVYGAREKALAPPPEDRPLERRYRAIRTRDPERIAICRNAHPPIMERNVWERIQTMMDGRKRQPGRPRGDSLLAGILRCPCGASMTIKQNGKGTRYYRCSRKSSQGHSTCRQPYVRADDVEQVVLDRLREDILGRFNPDTYRQRIASRQPIRSTMTKQAIEQAMEREMNKSTVLFDRFMDGFYTEEQFAAMNCKLQDRIQALRRTLAEVEQQSAMSGDPPEPNVISNVEHLFAAQSMGRKQLNAFIHEVRITQTGPSEIGLSIQYTWK